MIASILEKETCKACRNCCWYDDNDVWDAPGLTKSELKKATKYISTSFYEKNGLFFFEMIKHNGIYVCPLLDADGCKMKLEKPFKCSIWPLYVVHLDSRVSLAVSNECPTVSQLTNEEMLSRLGEVIIKIKEKITEAPELIEPFRPHYRIIIDSL